MDVDKRKWKREGRQINHKRLVGFSSFTTTKAWDVNNEILGIKNYTEVQNKIHKSYVSGF